MSLFLPHKMLYGTVVKIAPRLAPGCRRGLRLSSMRGCGVGDSNNNRLPPDSPESVLLDRYIIPVTVLATGAFLAPGVKAMLQKPVYLWLYRNFYDFHFNMNEFLAGARRALYFVAGKAFRKDFLGLQDVLTPEGMASLRESVRDDSFRNYLNLGSPSTPVSYERICAAGFVESAVNRGEDENVQLYGHNDSSASLPEWRFEILVFFVCKIERLIGADATGAKDKAGQDYAVLGRKESRGRNYTRLLVIMTFSRLLERKRIQTSDWLVSSMALVPLQYSFSPSE